MENLTQKNNMKFRSKPELRFPEFSENWTVKKIGDFIQRKE